MTRSGHRVTRLVRSTALAVVTTLLVGTTLGPGPASAQSLPATGEGSATWANQVLGLIPKDHQAILSEAVAVAKATTAHQAASAGLQLGTVAPGPTHSGSTRPSVVDASALMQQDESAIERRSAAAGGAGSCRSCGTHGPLS